MSQENAKQWRTSIEDFLAAGTSEDERERLLARMAELWHPQIEWDASGGFDAPDISGVFRGKEAVKQWWREWLAAWETLWFKYELIDAGSRVVLLLDLRMRGRSTGVEVGVGKHAQIATFRDGLMIHWKIYMSQTEALEAAGMSEQDAHADS